MESRKIFITGGTGYIGSRLIPLLAERGHKVNALIREGSQHRLSSRCNVVLGNALDPETFASRIEPADTFIQLVGVSHPSPAKAELFRKVDLVSATASVRAAVRSGIQHFIYISVAHPAGMMKEYIAVRCEVEGLIQESGMNATILRPWYVLGPGHRWPYLLVPVYWLLEKLPRTRASARRLGLLTIQEMLSAVLRAVENPPRGIRVMEVPEIRSAHQERSARKEDTT